MRKIHPHKHLKTRKLPLLSSTSTLLIALFVVVACASIITSPAPKKSSTIEAKFTDASKNGLAIVPASGSSSPCPGVLARNPDGFGFQLYSGATHQEVIKYTYDFCVSNSSGDYYFIPGKTNAELKSFYDDIPNLPGTSKIDI